VRRVEQQRNRQAAQPGAVARLRRIPGVGIRTAEAVAAFIDDPHRFGNAKAVGFYFGLVPCQDQSGDKNRLGPITREGAPVVRQLVAEAAWQAQRRSPTVRAYFERVPRDDPQRQKFALVATAHYLVRVMWAMRNPPQLHDPERSIPCPLPGAGNVGHAEARGRLAREPRAGQGVRGGRVRRPRGGGGRRQPRRNWGVLGGETTAPPGRAYVQNFAASVPATKALRRNGSSKQGEAR
jgi:hypothetical protein